jgi:hypothetical protein
MMASFLASLVVDLEYESSTWRNTGKRAKFVSLPREQSIVYAFCDYS